MAQFSVYQNINPTTRNAFPLLLDVQADLLSDLRSRVVVPLRPLNAQSIPLTRLTPVFEILGARYLMLTPQLAGVALSALGAEAGSLRDHRTEIVAALDMLVVGI
ncbi:MAG: CcdB family protein [Pseudomonadota bacterium]